MRLQSLLLCIAVQLSVPQLFFLPTAHPTLTVAREGTPQNSALRKGGTKQYVATKNANHACKP
jgi:hypothetical protein